MQGEDHTLSMSNGARPSDAADFASLKDGVLMAPSTDQATDTVLLAIKCPSLSETSSESTLLSVPSRFSISQVKTRIEASWIGKPQAQGMRMFKSGQLLTDDVIVGDIVPQHDRTEPAAVHLVIRSSAWTEPRPSMQRRATSHRSARRTPSPHPAWVAAETVGTPPILPADSGSSTQLPSIPAFPLMEQTFPAPRMDRALASVIESMDPTNYNSFRSLLTWSYHRYVDMYDDLWQDMYGEKEQRDKPSGGRAGKIIEQMAQMMDCTPEEVVAAVTVVEKDALQWDPVEEELAKEGHQGEGNKTYKTVTLQGLPYLLQVDRDSRSGPLTLLLGRIKKLQDIIHRMDKLISYQNLFQQASHTATLQENLLGRQSAILAAGGGAFPHNTDVPPVAGQATRQYRLRLVFNMTEFLNIALPAFFLSLKVTLLVYVFTRGASKFKTCMIAGAGLLFVVFEAWKSAQRHNTARQRAAVRETERQAGLNGQRQAPAPTEQAPTPTDDSLETLRPRAPLRRRATSPLTVDYWIESLAYVGLASEEEEMKWHPHAHRRTAPPTMFELAKNYVLLPLLLMAITLIPEIEQKRRKAIDEREELIRATAKKVQDHRDRLREKKRAEEATSTEKEEGVGQQQQQREEEETPSYLQHPYCQRVIHHRRSGRQIDIAQELEAAAAAADDQPADMGFL